MDCAVTSAHKNGLIARRQSRLPYSVKKATSIFINRLSNLTALVWLVLLACSTPLQAFAEPTGLYPPLAGQSDPELQKALEKALGALPLKKAIAEKRLAVSVIDITDEFAPRVAQINQNQMLYAASLPKIAILLGAMQRVHDGQLELTDALADQLVSMIRKSSNVEASRVLKLVGEAYLADLLQSEPYQFYKRDRGGLWVGRPYNSGPVWKRDPLNNISHGATSHEVARFYYLLATNRLVSPESCELMRDALSNPAIKHKFVAAIAREHPTAQIMRKSGTWRTYHSDSAIIDHDGKRYILVALANDPNAGRWLEKIALAVDRILFET